jgi:two-component system chemotaxis response regulator CheY
MFDGTAKIAGGKPVPAKVLIVARPGRLRNSLQALLASTTQIEVVGQVDGSLELAKMIAQAMPDLVLLDVNLSRQRYETVLDQLRERWPRIRRLVLTENHRQQETARVAGADGVLMKGFVISDLLLTIQTLLG